MLTDPITAKIDELTEKSKNAEGHLYRLRMNRKEYLSHALYGFLGFLAAALVFLVLLLADDLEKLIAEGDSLALWITGGGSPDSFMFSIGSFVNEHEGIFTVLMILFALGAAFLLCFAVFNLCRGIYSIICIPSGKKKYIKQKAMLENEEKEFKKITDEGRRIYEEAISHTPAEREKLIDAAEHRCVDAIKKLITDTAAECDFKKEKESYYPSFADLVSYLPVLGFPNTRDAFFEIILWVKDDNFNSSPDYLSPENMPDIMTRLPDTGYYYPSDPELSSVVMEERSHRWKREAALEKKERADAAARELEILKMRQEEEMLDRLKKAQDDDWIPPHIDVTDV